MSQFFPYFENIGVSEQIKTLATDELLDFWEETQYLDKYFEKELGSVQIQSIEYERAVLQELQLRSCRGRLYIR